ncbi:hypothetical protein ACFY0P_04740 [Streptomyces sp. NPDC001714]|uniref:hypothetical protein n=1 Tax=Streptomyces sp. NPDC001714 TaxID=3364603 RepID=UPI003693F548
MAVLHDVVDDHGRPCVVMEYVPAPALADLLDGGRTLPHEEAARIGLGTIGARRTPPGSCTGTSSPATCCSVRATGSCSPPSASR